MTNVAFPAHPHLSPESLKPAPVLVFPADVKKASVPLSISCPGIKHKVAKSYRTRDHQVAWKRPKGAFLPPRQEAENHILANRHGIKRFVAKKMCCKQGRILPFLGFSPTEPGPAATHQPGPARSLPVGGGSETKVSDPPLLLLATHDDAQVLLAPDRQAPLPPVNGQRDIRLVDLVTIQAQAAAGG